jgi:hypothetical protein
MAHKLLKVTEDVAPITGNIGPGRVLRQNQM